MKTIVTHVHLLPGHGRVGRRRVCTTVTAMIVMG